MLAIPHKVVGILNTLVSDVFRVVWNRPRSAIQECFRRRPTGKHRTHLTRWVRTWGRARTLLESKPYYPLLNSYFRRVPERGRSSDPPASRPARSIRSVHVVRRRLRKQPSKGRSWVDGRTERRTPAERTRREARQQIDSRVRCRSERLARRHSRLQPHEKEARRPRPVSRARAYLDPEETAR